MMNLVRICLVTLFSLCLFSCDDNQLSGPHSDKTLNFIGEPLTYKVRFCSEGLILAEYTTTDSTGGFTTDNKFYYLPDGTRISRTVKILYVVNPIRRKEVSY